MFEALSKWGAHPSRGRERDDWSFNNDTAHWSTMLIPSFAMLTPSQVRDTVTQCIPVVDIWHSYEIGSHHSHSRWPKGKFHQYPPLLLFKSPLIIIKSIAMLYIYMLLYIYIWLYICTYIDYQRIISINILPLLAESPWNPNNYPPDFDPIPIPPGTEGTEMQRVCSALAWVKT
jgi:hypothetical protein